MATLAEIAKIVDGQVQGDPAVEIFRVKPIDLAGEGDITFVANPKYLSQLERSQASAVIVSPGIESETTNLVVCANPYLAFAKILTLLGTEKERFKGVMPGAIIDTGAKIAEKVSIYPGAIIGAGVTIGNGTVVHSGAVVYAGAVVGEDCLIHANAVIREQCCLGDRVILQPGAIIGADGFGYAPDGASYYKIPQVGIVQLEDDVEIGAGTCIDRAAMGVTRVGRGTKIDNLVQIGHNVEIGEDTIMVSQVAVAGSSKIGNHCTFGGQAAVAGHLKVGDNLTAGPRSGITNDMEGNQVVTGAPPLPHRQFLKASKLFGKLPEISRELKRLQKQVAALLEKQE